MLDHEVNKRARIIKGRYAVTTVYHSIIIHVYNATGVTMRSWGF